MQTAVADVTNPGSKKSVKARFDWGHRGHIFQIVLEMFSKNLLIKRFGNFGSEKEKPNSCDVVKFSLSKPGGGIHFYVDALSVETICSPGSKQKIRVAR